MTRESLFILSALIAACAALATPALAEGGAPSEPRLSRAVQLSEAELDAITAGEVTGQHVIINNGNAVVDKTLNNQIHCVNCVPFPTPAHVQVITNRAQTVTHCKGTPLC